MIELHLLRSTLTIQTKTEVEPNKDLQFNLLRGIVCEYSSITFMTVNNTKIYYISYVVTTVRLSRQHESLYVQLEYCVRDPCETVIYTLQITISHGERRIIKSIFLYSLLRWIITTHLTCLAEQYVLPFIQFTDRELILDLCFLPSSTSNSNLIAVFSLH